MNKPLVMHARRPSARRATQRGAVAIVVGLTLVVLVGMVGLAIDGGHLYLTKTELQNASDACALAASYNLTGAPAISQASFIEADAAGVTVGARNKVDFQGSNVANADITVEFAESLTGGAWLKATSNPSANSKYVRCTLQRTGITPYLMQVMGFGDQTVKAMATATLAPSQSNCAVPMGLCTPTGSTPPEYGYVKGNWYGLDFKDTGGNANYTGNFRWLDFDPNKTTPGCPGAGAGEIACVMQGTGQCSLPPPNSGSCPKTGGTTPPGCVGENGNVSKMEAAYNSRFGVYKGGGGNPNLNNAPPDFTGRAYDSSTWSLARDAFNGTGAPGESNFKAARTAHMNTQSAFYSSPYSNTTVEDHTSHGADRRVVVVPIVDCNSFTGGGQYAPIRAYACVLLLDPYRKSSSSVITQFEYLGLANAPGSPCASSGVTGDDSSQGPLVPSLVQ
ncbi:pilus assembly protein TadG-related protein [Ideonella sp.]|uniref:pilus assembly protein TadG-related protein n=1 Tax=Ideonella sp. TaxID=1929293 RepID=UPI002B4712BE|nr:pilus assembly protein TadG-related protein [Ideonella sp.]HJV69442.1 pilus assembly protein TadG-related protein [Ideonella sp.]